MSFRVSLDYELLIETPTGHVPEKRLLIAVIHRAILDFYGHDAHSHHQAEAARWLFQDTVGFMSLHWVCTWLSDDPKWLQKSIQQMVKNGERPMGPIMRVDR